MAHHRLRQRQQVIRHRLRIRPESQPPAVWYKDEGGRDKCIEVTVDLVDAEGRRVQGQVRPGAHGATVGCWVMRGGCWTGVCARGRREGHGGCGVPPEGP
jgi:hypothetical protein